MALREPQLRSIGQWLKNTLMIPHGLSKRNMACLEPRIHSDSHRFTCNMPHHNFQIPRKRCVYIVVIVAARVSPPTRSHQFIQLILLQWFQSIYMALAPQDVLKKWGLHINHRTWRPRRVIYSQSNSSRPKHSFHLVGVFTSHQSARGVHTHQPSKPSPAKASKPRRAADRPNDHFVASLGSPAGHMRKNSGAILKAEVVCQSCTANVEHPLCPGMPRCKNVGCRT